MNKKVLNIFNNPKHAGRITKPSGIASNSNLDGTFNVEFSIRVEDDAIREIKFRAQANPYIIAVCETIADMLTNKTINLISLDEFAIKAALEDDTDTDINFCLDCVRMAVTDYLVKLEKSNKQKA